MKPLLSISFLIIADQITKCLVPKLGIETRLNTGGAFGLLGNYAWFQTIVHTTLTILILLFFIRKNRFNQPAKTGLYLFIAGGIGNVIDRLLFGGVRDFIHLPLWPSFNAADVYISIGSLIIVFSLLKELKSKISENV